MAVSVSSSARCFTSRYGDPVADRDGARIRAHCRHVATVVTISGRIDGANNNLVGECVKRFLLSDKPLVLDLSGLTSFSADAIPFLNTFDDRCLAAGVDWALVASDAVSGLLQIHGEDVRLPLVRSVAQALHNFDDVILDRRQRLLPLLGKLGKTA